MKKFLLSLLLIIINVGNLFAQRDTEHWIAPYYTSTSGYKQSLYLSTDSLTPFVVTIYSNNAVVGTATISNGAPTTFIVADGLIGATTPSDAFNVINKGLYLKADKPFYATLRLASSTTHAEIVTSKGKAGIGTEFFVAATPSPFSSSSNNFTAGVLATENNTTVTATWNNNVAFIGTLPAGLARTYTFTLQKGESFIFAGAGGTASNLMNFTGAKIVSDKPITLTNGNMNGNFGTGSSSGSDSILDQSVPLDRLGNTFAMVRTRSTLNDLEGGLIIATEDNTQVYLNGSATAIATLNAGQWYRISGTNYITQNAAAQHSNMYISTTKNVYLYQLVAVGTSNATCGFNYIPPLNCFLPRKIDEIPFINEMPTATTGASTTPSGTIIKLNIITEAGANVTINGRPTTATEGPFPVTGNANWVTYSATGLTGNVRVQSDKAVTAGINGGFSTAGYGGYFAGFSSIPLISKTNGDCIPGMILEVDDSYDTYQWFRNGIAIPGANGNRFTPTQSGTYTAQVSVGSCNAAMTPEYKVYTCLTESAMTKNVCEGYLDIVPAFTNSTQTFVPATVQIITPPANGTATINPVTGVIGYTPTYGFVGTDRIVYKFCGNNPDFTDCEQVTITINIAQSPTVQDATLRTCFLPENVATGRFDLTTATVSTGAGNTLQYYPSLTDANNNTNEILNPADYVAPTGQVYVRVTNASGCYKVAKINLVVFAPSHSTELQDKIICIEETTTLDAGAGFDGYVWDDGTTAQTVSGVAVGTHWVDLIKGGCTTRQYVTVYASEQPVISSVDVSANNVTVNVLGGTAPYKYSLDNIVWQDSNVFTEIPRGNITIYVKDSYGCNPISIQVTVPNLINVITPNGDGVNDILDYSALASKQGISFAIFDRYGVKIFEGTKDNQFKWDGSLGAGKKVSTGNYWYSIGWNEAQRNTPVKYTGWILVKNRE